MTRQKQNTRIQDRFTMGRLPAPHHRLAGPRLAPHLHPVAAPVHPAPVPLFQAAPVVRVRVPAAPAPAAQAPAQAPVFRQAPVHPAVLRFLLHRVLRRQAQAHRVHRPHPCPPAPAVVPARSAAPVPQARLARSVPQARRVPAAIPAHRHRRNRQAPAAVPAPQALLAQAVRAALAVLRDRQARPGHPVLQVRQALAVQARPAQVHQVLRTHLARLARQVQAAHPAPAVRPAPAAPAHPGAAVQVRPVPQAQVFQARLAVHRPMITGGSSFPVLVSIRRRPKIQRSQSRSFLGRSELRIVQLKKLRKISMIIRITFKDSL